MSKILVCRQQQDNLSHLKKTEFFIHAAKRYRTVEHSPQLGQVKRKSRLIGTARFIIFLFHSMFDVQCSMLDVHFFFIGYYAGTKGGLNA